MVELVNAENIVPLLVRSVRSIDHGQLQFEVSPIAASSRVDRLHHDQMIRLTDLSIQLLRMQMF